MKKLISCIAVLAMMTAMTACGNDDSSVSRVEKTTSAAAETKAEAEETAEKATETEKETEAEKKTTKATEKAEESEESSGDPQENANEGVLADCAVELMDNMASIWRPLSGDVTIDESDTIEYDGRNYSKLININNFDSVDDLKGAIDATCAGDLYDQFIDSVDRSFIEQDGSLYTCSQARGFYIFRTEEGVTISDATDEEFTATCNKFDDMNGIGSAHFVMTNGGWRMDSYEFK